EALIFRVKFCGVVGIAAAPGGAVVVDEPAEGCSIGGLLLGASADEGEERPEEGESDIEQPTPAFHFDGGRRTSDRSHPKLLLGVRMKCFAQWAQTGLVCVGIP